MRDARSPGGVLEGCQCQGPRPGRGRQRNQFAVTWDTRLAPVCFETILMVAERIKQADLEIGEPAIPSTLEPATVAIDAY